MIELPLLYHFVAVARTRSFTRASEQVHASQSVISRSIKRLEEEVGTALFERTTRQVRLTPAGEALLAEAVSIIDRLAVARDNARRIGQGMQARLRVGVCPSASPETPRIVQCLQMFRAAWPHVDVEFVSAMRNRQGQALRASDIDIGLMMLSRMDCAGIMWHVIARNPLVVALPRAWDMRKVGLRLGDLHDRSWVMPHPEIAPDMYQLQMELCRSAGFEPKIAGLADDAVTGSIMMSAGLGAAFVNDRGLRPRDENIDILPLDGISNHFSSETVIAWAVGATSKHISEFVRCMLETKPQLDNKGR